MAKYLLKIITLFLEPLRKELVSFPLSQLSHQVTLTGLKHVAVVLASQVQGFQVFNDLSLHDWAQL